MTPLQIQATRAALTIQPVKIGNHPGEVPGPIKLYVETDDRLGIPREYFLARRKNHDVEFQVTDGNKDLWAGPLTFAGSLRPEQSKAIEFVSGAFLAGQTGMIIRAAPGWGKTVAACGLIAKLQVPTLVVVHKEFLVNQWKERIEQFLPGSKVGIIQQDSCDFAGKHIAIAMVHSLVAREYSPLLYRWPGLVITDEVHRIAAETWSHVPTKFPARWRIGISATPRRKDGADNVFLWHIGEVGFKAKEQRLQPKIRRVWTKFRLVETSRFNPNLASKPIMLQFLCANAARNQLIIEQVIMAAQMGRKLLVLSERLKHLDVLDGILRRFWPDNAGPPPTTGFYIGGLSQDALDEAAKAQVIFATSQLVSEGLDIPALDTIFLTTPLGDVEQAVGRILRPSPGKKEPIVVDFRDDEVRVFAKYGEMRDKLYSRIT
jgi:superfamily II DNA or RNA helicase